MTTIDALESLAEGFSGVILAPGDAGYDAARKIHNGLIDKRPALIACCRNTADIVDAVNAAREADLEISVRGDQRLDCRPCESGDEEQNLATGRWKPGKARAHDLAETAGNR